MNRPTRSRRPPLKYTEDEVVSEPNSKKTSNKVAGTISDNNKEMSNDAGNVVAPKSRSAKGNLLAGKRHITQSSRSPVLRDRTNLPEEPLKVDILVKKGADDETAKKTAKRKKQADTALEVPEEKKVKGRGRVKKQPAVNQKSRKLSSAKEKQRATQELDNNDNSLVIESENDTEKVPLVKATTKNIVKRIAISKRSPSKLSEKSVENGKKKLSRRPSKVTSKVDVPTTTDSTVEKKFFKSKASAVADSKAKISPVKKVLTSKRGKLAARDKPTVSTSFRLRQTTLSESFAKQATKKSLRPRATQKNYREQTTILEKTAGNDEGAIKKPVYKTAKLQDSNDDDGGEVYEFHFDSNDSRERIKKKGKKTLRKIGIMRKKTRAKNSKKTISTRNVKSNNNSKEPQAEFIATSEEAPMDPPAMNNFDPPADVTKPKNVGSPVEKPKIVECVPLTGDARINLTTTPQPAKSTVVNAGPLRTTNPFNVRSSVQYRTMRHHALLNKSLSPIKKDLEEFDIGSPWRPPPIVGPQFSRIKNVVQSTPYVVQSTSHGRKFLTVPEKNKPNMESKVEPGLTAEMKVKNIAKKNENNEILEEINVTAMPPKVLGSAKSPRKFGTVISNINVSTCSSSPVVINESNGKSELNEGSPRPAHLSENTRISINEPDNFEDHADKENSIPLPASPKKTFKSPKKFAPKQSPLRPFNRLKTATTRENWEPQPGPSGLQKRNPLCEMKYLVQSNLNNFLNIEQMPTSTRISGAHGIFADAHSTPINGRPVKTLTKEANLENAFGFDNGDSDIDISPIKHELFAERPLVPAVKKRLKIEPKKPVTQPTRFSVREIKKHLQPIVAKDKGKIDPIQRIEVEEKENRETKVGKSHPENQQVGNAHKISDTFDVLTEAFQTNDKENAEEIPLFADLEPVHFKQPPRHSYKRKRIAFNLSEDEEEEGDDDGDDDERGLIGNEKRGTKKRKMNKVDKQREEKMEEWAKDLNHTFEEIDHFNLVVE